MGGVRVNRPGVPSNNRIKLTKPPRVACGAACSPFGEHRGFRSLSAVLARPMQGRTRGGTAARLLAAISLACVSSCARPQAVLMPDEQSVVALVFRAEFKELPADFKQYDLFRGGGRQEAICPVAGSPRGIAATAGRDSTCRTRIGMQGAARRSSSRGARPTRRDLPHCSAAARIAK